MLKFAIESVLNVWPELVKIHFEHWKETEGYRHNQPFAPSLERYLEYERIDWYALFTARDNGVLVGNLGVYFTPSMHTQELIATEDTLFLLPWYRRGRNAVRFLQFAEAECVRRGVVEIAITAKDDKVGRLLQHLDYRQVAVQYSKPLGRADSAESSTTVNTENTDVRANPPEVHSTRETSSSAAS